MIKSIYAVIVMIALAGSILFPMGLTCTKISWDLRTVKAWCYELPRGRSLPPVPEVTTAPEEILRFVYPTDRPTATSVPYPLPTEILPYP